MKILLYSRSYKDMAGGIERKSLEIARGLSDRGHEVHIVSLDSNDDVAFYEWPKEVRWHKTNIGNPALKASLRERLGRIFYIRRLLKQDFDIAVGFQVGAFAVLRISALGLKVGIIAAERNAPTLFDFISRGKVKRLFSNLLLLTSTKIAILFPDFRRYYPSYLQKKLVITPNWVELSKKVSGREITRIRNQILFIGRISFQKNLNSLLEAAALSNQETELLIIGSGDGLESAKAKAVFLGLNCRFIPPTRDLSSYYESAALLCLPSRWEGFPNVAAEALAFGLPVVGFEACAGLPELVIPGKTGELALENDNPHSLRQALQVALDSKYSEEFIQKSVAGYTFENFISAWETACFVSLKRKP